MKPELRPGDVFAVDTEKFFAKLITLRNKISASDCNAIYNHNGVIIKEDSTTFESRRKITHYNLDDYEGKQILIARPIVQGFVAESAIKRLNQYDGKTYPWWRIIVHAISPTLAKYLTWSGIPVCSELVAMYLNWVGVRHGGFFGTTPDMLADEWEHWREYEIIFNGKWPCKENYE